MRANDAVSGFVLIAFAVIMFALTLNFPAFPGQRYGPSLFPRILAVGIAIGGIVLVLRGLVARRTDPRWLTLAGWTSNPGKVVNFALILLMLLFYILASERLGFLVTSFIVLTGLIARFGTRLIVAVPVAAIATVVIQWFFGAVMRIPLPRGDFGITF